MHDVHTWNCYNYDNVYEQFYLIMYYSPRRWIELNQIIQLLNCPNREIFMLHLKLLLGKAKIKLYFNQIMIHEDAIIDCYDWNLMPIDKASSYAFILRRFNDVKFNLEGFYVYRKS